MPNNIKNVIKKVTAKKNQKIIKPLSKELMSYGVKNELARYVGLGKKIVPRFIPFVNNNQIDITDALKIQGINPASYSSAATQFDVAAGINCQAGHVTRIPIKTPQDSLFFMNTIRYSTVLTSNEKWPVVAQNATLKNKSYYYDKWNQNTAIGGQFMTHIELNGSAATPDATVTPPASITAFDTNALHDGMIFILPLYADDETDPSTADPTGYVQLQIASMASDGSTFELADMSGTAYEVNFSGESPVMWPFNHGSNSVQVPYTHYLKVGLNANSPKKLEIYGGLANVPRLTTGLGTIDNALCTPHIERLYVDTLQGQDNSFNSIVKPHLFGQESTITIEIENLKTHDLLVNGYVYGFQVYERGNV